jgi:hypothetical protein
LSPKAPFRNKKAILLIGKVSHILPAWRRWNRSDKSIISEDTVLNQDFKEFIQSLNNNDVPDTLTNRELGLFHLV